MIPPSGEEVALDITYQWRGWSMMKLEIVLQIVHISTNNYRPSGAADAEKTASELCNSEIGLVIGYYPKLIG